MTDQPAIAALLEKLYHPELARIDLSLARVERFLELLGSPHRKIPPVIHVAGTNGKGSLIANLHAILEAAGYRVHRYISPHLERFNERIVIGGKEIDDTSLETLLKRVVAAVEKQPVTFFEATTAAAFLAFAEQKADVTLLEVGMGGAFDATNVVAQPLLTAITPVSMDHAEFLGDTLNVIAGEKAGIIKSGVPCVVGRQEEEAATVIASIAAIKHAPLYRMNTEWSWAFADGKALYNSPKRRAFAFAPGLVGKHQYDNAATAIACIDHLSGFTITDAHIAEGLANVHWPARLQRLEKGKLAALVPGMELWLDGGHNPQCGAMLADWAAQQDKEIHLICGMVQKKDTLGYLRPLAPHISSLYAIAIPDEETSQPAEAIHDAGLQLGMEAHLAPSLEKALQSAASRAKKPAIAIIAGSLYLAGKVLSANKE